MKFVNIRVKLREIMAVMQVAVGIVGIRCKMGVWVEVLLSYAEMEKTGSL